MIFFGEHKQASFSLAPGKTFTAKRAALTAALIVFMLLYYFFASAPRNFPTGETISISEGISAGEVIKILAEKKVIRSTLVLRLILTLSGQSDDILAGDYLMAKPISIFQVAKRLALGEFDLTPIRITVPEGNTSFEMADLFGNDFYNFDKDKFSLLAEMKEGYLFPDTYFFLPNATAETVIRSMTNNFNRRIAAYENDIKKSGRTLEEIIIMASIIEKEAKKPEDKKLISGILWRRLQIKMPLQVDAPFAYISDKSTYELTQDDLKQSSPYNTYNRLGLTPSPIANPGAESILAAIYPKPSSYLYYLSDKIGNIYYAVTFEEHKKNKVKYLK